MFQPNVLVHWVCIKLFEVVGEKIFGQQNSIARGSDIEACGPYHSLNTLLFVGPGQFMCSLECRPPSPTKRLACIMLLMFFWDHIYVRLRSTVLGSDIEAFGPYHSLNTQFVQSPSQAALLNSYPRQSMCTLECRIPSVPNLLVHCFCIKLFKVVGNHIFVRQSQWFVGGILRPAG